MTVAGSSPRAGPSVCPFVALAEDRDRRADAPDERNRCYAERAPRRRDLAYQAEYCYSPGFASCSIFLAWAARNAAEPAYVTEAARSAWASGVAVPETLATEAVDASPPGWGGPEPPTPEDGFFGPPPRSDDERAAPAGGEHDWVSASAWEGAPWDPLAEAEAAELEELEALADLRPAPPAEEPELPSPEEALQGPRVPAAVPMRRRRPSLTPIKARGSGEWLYADPPGRRTMVRRGGGIGAPLLLSVLGLLVIAIVVFSLTALLGGGTPQPGAGASSTAATTRRPSATRAPRPTLEVSPSPSIAPEPRIRVYTVKPGNTLSQIAERFEVSQRHLQCYNVITNPNVIQPGQKLLIPPEGYSCPPGWRNMTPPPIPE